MKYISKQIIIFGVCGLINTISSYLLYLLFLSFMPYKIAYSISYLAAIFISYYLNSKFTFNSRSHVKGLLYYPFTYLITYLLGLGLLHVLVSNLGINTKIAPLILLFITVPLSFIMNKLFFYWQDKHAQRT